jgi:hypothetical protein
MSCNISGAYIFKKGDRLINIVQQRLNSGDRWHEILKANSTPLTEVDAHKLVVVHLCRLVRL